MTTKSVIYHPEPTPDYPEGAGWYFVDETEGLNGPYQTSEEAETAYWEYVNFLL